MDKIFGLAEHVLSVSEQRASMLSANLVNANTPNYKAKDIDFNQVMKSVSDPSSRLQVTNSNHISSANNDFYSLPVQYRIPMQKSLDGNTVDPEIERKSFVENSLKYQLGLTFIQNKTHEMIKAMKGE